MSGWLGFCRREKIESLGSEKQEREPFLGQGKPDENDDEDDDADDVGVDRHVKAGQPPVPG